MTEPGLADFLVAHHVGDYLLQTDVQAMRKAGGLGADPEARRALLTHGLTYTLAFTPLLAQIARRRGRSKAVAAAALIGLPHVVVDDGRFLRRYMTTVKGADPDATPWLTTAVDQSMHMLCLWAARRMIG